ncbi:PEGA domain-containing protein [Treponema primitia]|nr:PEGA domain-containing protein [Treponema primitia]
MKKLICLLLILAIFTGCQTTTLVNINTNIPDARVTIDGKTVGSTPITKTKIKNSVDKKYRIVIEKEGYETLQRTLHTETKKANAAAVVVGYVFCWALIPMLLWINAAWLEGPVPDQYFILTESNLIERPQLSVRATKELESAVMKLSDVLAQQLTGNTTLAVLSISSSDRESAEYITDELEYQLVNTGKFKIVNRNTIDKIKEEQNFQLSGDVSDNSALSIGKMLGANIVITGTVSGTGSTRRISVKALDVQTAEIIAMLREQF